MPGRPRWDHAPAALSSDAWYTLIYLPDAARRELHRERRRVWEEPLLRAGQTRAEATRGVDELTRWKERRELHGRTPTLPEQAEHLARVHRLRLDGDAISERMDRPLLRAPVRVSPGARETLRELAGIGVRLAIVSNVLNESGGAARAVLDRAGLLRWFEVVYLSCEHRFAKPSPEPFRDVSRFLGVAPSELAHVGDLRYDVLGARRAGARPFLFVRFARLNRYLAGHCSASVVPRSQVVRSWSELGRLWTESPPPRP